MKFKMTALIAIVMLSACSESPESEAKKLISDRLKDPDSVQFRNVVKGPTDKSGKYVLCGELNAKNSMGGYGGFVGFLTTGGNVNKPPVFIGDDDYGRLALTSAKRVMPETKECPF